MNHIWLSTANTNKRNEFATLLAPFGLHVHTPDELDTSFQPVAEVGQTFAENAVLKAQALYDIVQAPVIADDSGLIVDALAGYPGIYSARYAGIHATDAENKALLLQQMKDETNRQARFICAIAFIQSETTIDIFEGIANGEILTSERGDAGFGYDSIFFSPELGMTFAEATAIQKHTVSHRARALNKLLDKLKT
jgi:XTP/dITP diphosphohydrolase